MTASISLARRPQRYETLDVWRGIACLMVVVFHASSYARHNPAEASVAGGLIQVFARGWMGVPIFFVISGYCIIAAADSSRIAEGSVARFFARRLRRIFPPYWVALGCTLILVLIVAAISPGFLTDDPNGVAEPGALTRTQWLGNLTLSEGWRRHLSADPTRYFLGHAWTLGYEEQFYAVTGLLLFLPKRWFVAGTAGITLLTLGLFLANRLGAQLPIDGFFFDGRWLLFAAGGLVYFGGVSSSLLVRNVCLLVLVAGLAGSAHAPWKLALIESNFWQELFVASAFGIAILLLQPFDGRTSRISVLAPLRVIGRMGFSLYLVHLPVVKLVAHLLVTLGIGSNLLVVLVTVPVCACAALAVAWPFYRLVERHFVGDGKPVPAPLALP